MRPNANSLFLPAAILLLALAIQHASAADEDYVTLAKRYCEEEIKPDDKCTWVDGKEWKALNLDVFMEGTAVGGWDGPPAMIEPYSSMFQYFPSFMSLSCKGTVKVETVFMLYDYDTATYGPGDGDGAGLVCGDSGQKIRCNLGTGPTPSISNATTQCVVCSDTDANCPFEAGTWYSDTLYQDIGSQCPPNKDAYPGEADIYVNPGQTLYVASFTVEEVNQLD